MDMMKNENLRLLVGSRIREAMSKKGVNAKWMCDVTGIPKGSMSKYVNGLFIPKREALNKIADVLGVSPAWIMGLEKVTDEEYDARLQQKSDEEIDLIETIKGKLIGLDEKELNSVLAFLILIAKK